MKVVVTEFMTLDGVIEDPGGAEKDKFPQGGWSMGYWADEIGKFKWDELFASDAHLLGRVTYEGFATAWPSRHDEFADRMNNLPHYVASTTLQKADWNNTHIVKGNVAEEIAKIKQQTGGFMLLAGSATLAQYLADHKLVDEYHLLIYPLVLGSGKRLFKSGQRTNLKLIEAKPLGKDVVSMVYQPAENK
jgi:dihydrofolate reductase